MEVVVVGGGIIGVCTAYCLLSHPGAPPDLTVTLVESCAEIACQASGKAAGFLARDWHGSETARLADLSWRMHLGLAERHGGRERWAFRRMDSLGCEVDLRRTGSGRPRDEGQEVVGNPALEGSVMRGKPEGAVPDEARSVGSWLRPGARREVYGDQTSTAQVHPQLFTRAVHALAEAKGLKTVHGVPTSLERSGDGLPRSVTYRARGTTVAGSLRCTHVVIAAGPWSPKVMSLFSSRRLPGSFLPGHHAILRPRRPLDPTAVFATVRGSTGPRTTTSPEIFPRPDGTVWIGGENEAAGLPDDPDEVPSLVDGAIVDRLLRSAAAVSEELGEAEVERIDLCYRPVGGGGGGGGSGPVVEEWERRVFVGTNHGPWGITLGPGTGARLAMMVLGEEATVESFLSSSSPAAAPRT